MFAPMTRDERVHWEDYAKFWDRLGPPLRPCAADVAYFEEQVEECAAGRDTAGGRALILGVTPELALMKWPMGYRVIGIDLNFGMVQGVWPVHGMKDRHVVCGDWQRLPLANVSTDVCIADGCFSMLGYPESYERLACEVHCVLKPGGLFMFRTFARSNEVKTPEEVVSDLVRGKIKNFHEFKFRLAIALQSNTRSGVGVDAVWRAWNDIRDEVGAVSKTLGWDENNFATVEVYSGSITRYSFPTVQELREIFAAYFLECSYPQLEYEFGSHCPIFALSKKDQI